MHLCRKAVLNTGPSISYCDDKHQQRNAILKNKLYCTINLILSNKDINPHFTSVTKPPKFRQEQKKTYVL